MCCGGTGRWVSGEARDETWCLCRAAPPFSRAATSLSPAESFGESSAVLAIYARRVVVVCGVRGVDDVETDAFGGDFYTPFAPQEFPYTPLAPQDSGHSRVLPGHPGPPRTHLT